MSEKPSVIGAAGTPYDRLPADPHTAGQEPPDETTADAPLSDDEFERGLGAMLARRTRAVTGLSQPAFAEQYGIPVASLRDWEQGRRAPDAATRSYLKAISRLPDAIAKALRDAA